MGPEEKKYILENAGKRSAEEIARHLGLRPRKVKKFIDEASGSAAPARTPPKNHPAVSRTRSPDRAVILFSAALIILLGAAAYLNSVKGAFIYDDILLIKNNTFIKQWSCLNKIFTEDIGKSSGIDYKFYRPIQIITYALDYSFWKLDPRGYHITSIILHIMVALSLYWLLNCLFHDKILALFAAGLFVVHPVHTVVVSYISSRAEALYLLFMLTAFVFYIKSIHTRKWAPLFVMALSYALALLSKENSLIFPFLIVLYHAAFKEKPRAREAIALLAIVFSYIVFRLTVVASAAPSLAYHSSTLAQRLPGFFVALAGYVKLLFLPAGLHVGYGLTLFKFSDPRAIIGVILFFALAAGIFAARSRSRLIFFSLAWFLLTLLPVSNLYPLNSYMSENWLYLPSIGLFIILAGGLSLLYHKPSFRIAAAAIFAVLALFLSILTIRQNGYWKDPIGFFERTLKYAPDDAVILNHLGVAYENAGRKEEAVGMYKKAVKADPRSVTAHNNLGILCDNLGRTEEAITYFKKAIDIDPRYMIAYNNLGALYFKTGDMDEAMSLYKKAIEINPYFVEGHVNLAMVYGIKGKKQEAIAEYKRALELYPDYKLARDNLAELVNEARSSEAAATAAG